MSSSSPSATVIPSHFRTLTCPLSCLVSGRIRAWTQAKSMDGMVFAQWGLLGLRSCRLRRKEIRVWKEEGESGMRYNLGICLAPGLDHVCWELLGNHLEITLQPFLLQAGCPQLILWSMLCGWVCPHLRKAAWEPSVWEAQPSPHQVGDSQLALALPEV